MIDVPREQMLQSISVYLILALQNVPVSLCEEQAVRKIGANKAITIDWN